MLDSETSSPPLRAPDGAPTEPGVDERAAGESAADASTAGDSAADDSTADDSGQGWDRVRVVEALRVAAVRQREAETDQFALIAAAADVYAWVDNTKDIIDQLGGAPPRVLHGERLWQFGAEGTPEVAEFVTFEIGPALGISPEAAAKLIADVLDLRHRLPRTWQLLLAGQVRGWVARKIAETTRRLGLSLVIARELDRHIAPFVAGWSPTQTFVRVAMLIERLDPVGAEQRRQEALARRFVDVGKADSGTAVVRGQVDGPAGLALDQTLNELAEVLELGGLDGDRDQLRARALEALADPARAAELLNGTLVHLTDTDTDAATGADAGTGAGTAAGPARPDEPCHGSGGSGGSAGPDGPGSGGLDLAGAGDVVVRGIGGRGPAPVNAFGSPWQVGTLNLDLFVSAADLARGAGGECRQLGAVVLSQLQELIARAGRVVINPILDPEAPLAAEGYEVPEALQRSVKLRNPTSVFPYSHRASTGSGVDTDHVIPYPEGPTHTSNLAPTDRKAHRAKTFGGYTVVTVRPGVFLWCTPTGQRYWRTPHGTFTSDPTQARPVRPVTLADRARDALYRATRPAAGSGRPDGAGGDAGTGEAGEGERVRDKLPQPSRQPVLIPDPDPPLRWDGSMRPPATPADGPWGVPVDAPPPF